jgi:hypothetical protein
MYANGSVLVGRLSCPMHLVVVLLSHGACLSWIYAWARIVDGHWHTPNRAAPSAP